MTAVPGQASVMIREGFQMEMVIGGLDEPTSVALYEGKLLVSLNSTDTPRVIEVDDRESTPLLAGTDLPEGTLMPPLTSVRVNGEDIWITHRQMGVNGWTVGAISRFSHDDPRGSFRTVITDLPSQGDHYTEDLAFGADGRVYFAQGSATNSSLVGPDNASWLMDAPTFRDFPPVDVELAAAAYKTPDPTSSDPSAEATTAPYSRFNSGPVADGTRVMAPTGSRPVEGMVAGTASVYSFDAQAADPTASLRLEAWGFRNPYGIGFDPRDPSRLFVSNNGADVRSMEENGQVKVVEARPVANDLDDLFVVNVADRRVEFFGWPDFFHDQATRMALPITDPAICNPGAAPDLGPCRFAFSRAFRETLQVDDAFAQLQLHSSANKFDFSPGQSFGTEGDIFIAETGSFPPVTGATTFTGFKVVQVDRTGKVTDFVANRSEDQDGILDPAVMNKPIDVKFTDPNTMIIVDLGVVDPAKVIPSSGKIWRITPTLAGAPTTP
jgi:glucose/arabinose dehydrogenase